MKGDDGGEGKGTALLEPELGNVGVPSVYFVCFFKNTVSFQITDPLINLAEVGRGPSWSEEPTWPTFCLSQGGQFTNNPAPSTSSTVVCSEAPGCLPACWPSCLAAG